MKAIIYARESSDDTKKAPPIGKQIEIGMQWIKENNYELAEVYQDNGYSGGDWKRPDWNRLVREARGHKAKMLWIWSQDRIARDTEQFLWFYRNLKESHMDVFSHTEGMIDMTTAGDRIKHTSLAMAAEAFRLLTSDKVKRVYEAKKHKAELAGEKVVWGRKEKILDVNLIMELRKKGLGYKKIATELGNVCSYQTIRNIIKKYPSNNIEGENQNKGGIINNPIV